MFVEKRKRGTAVKFYLVYSYREGEVKKIRKYLGTNLSPGELQTARQQAELLIKKEIQDIEIFNFSLTKKQIERLSKYEQRIQHLQHLDWKKFTEQFTYNTNAIEGSTVQLSEVENILEKKKGENEEEIETIGVAKAVEFIRTTKEELSLNLIKKLHLHCFQGSKSFSGRFRKVEVVIRNGRGDIVHQGIPVARLNQALNEFISWYHQNKNNFKPLVLAAIIHNQFENIHPFQDGNGRVGRLLLNFILIKNKYPPINISLEDRAGYYQTLQEYSKNDNLKLTLVFLIKQYQKTLKQVATKK